MSTIFEFKNVNNNCNFRKYALNSIDYVNITCADENPKRISDLEW